MDIRCPMAHLPGRRRGFTLVELLVVLAIVALLLSIALPRYLQSVEYAKESALVQTLAATRTALDNFLHDTGRYPQSLEELVEKSYLRSLPVDPLLDSSSGWIVIPPAADTKGAVRDIRSSAMGVARNGRAFGEL